MPEHFPPVEGQTEWRVIRLPERRNYIHHDALLCCSTNTWQAAPAADLSTGKNACGNGSYSLTLYFLFLGKSEKNPSLCLVGHLHAGPGPPTLYPNPAPPPQNWRGLGFCNVDLWCSAWACLWWSASCWATLALMNKRSPKRRRICTKSHDWGADARLRNEIYDGFSSELQCEILQMSLF